MKFTWQPIRVAVLSLAAALALGSAHADTDPAKAFKEIMQWRSEQVKAAMDAKKPVDGRALMAESATKAKAAINGVDAAKVEPAAGLDWARLFQLAQQPANVIAATDRFLTTSPAAPAKFNAQMMEVSAYSQLGNTAALCKLLSTIVAPDKMTAAQVSLTAANFADGIAEKVGPQAALDLLKKVEAQTPWTEYSTPQEKNIADAAAARIAISRAAVLTSQGKSTEAVTALEDGKKHLSAGSRYAQQIDMQLTASKLVGSPAPAIIRERGYGDFPGLAACKGKVVLIDFMAHWCGPCKLSLPSMKKLYNDYHSQGLEIVSVTSYYGFLGNEKNLTPDAEFAKMDGFLKEEGMTWPVVFGPQSNMVSYGVSGIPNFVLIDKTGKVNSVVVGYNAELFAGLRKSVEGLLGVKVALK